MINNNNFRQFSLQPVLYDVIHQLKFQKPTEIQQQVIPESIKGQRIIGQSHTGSGKTHAYLLPMFHQIDSEKSGVQFVITAPTRKLATQIYEEVKKIIRYADQEDNWIAKLLVGGTERQDMAEKLKSRPQIIVGTPGRILDLVNENAISIYSASTFVIDEADLMLDLGFIKEV